MKLGEFKSGLIPDSTLAWRLGANVPAQWTVPAYCDGMPYCLPASDQGPFPRCAAFGCMTGCEARNWRLTDAFSQLDPTPVHEKAKEIDGMPDADGTTLTAVTQAAINLGMLPTGTLIRVVTTENDVRYACHTRGGCIAGFNITQDWMDSSGQTIVDTGAASIGGHAVFLAGYDSDTVWICNSWGTAWKWNGFAKLPWASFRKQFMSGVIWEGIPR